MMDFLDIPPTAFPKIQQFATVQTLSRQCSFSTYVSLAEFIQHVLLMRYRALKTITATIPATESEVEELIERLADRECHGALDHHGRVYSLYIVGAYNEASELVERVFQVRHKPIAKRLEEIKTQLNVIEIQSFLEAVLQACSATSMFQTAFKTRIKASGSLLAKLITTGSLDPFRILEFLPQDITPELMPYDLVGGEVLVNTTNEREFDEFVGSLVQHFESAGVQLKDQNVYSAPWMGRRFLEGKLHSEDQSTPFQLHIWDHKARRYEFMSYGNYKMNKLFFPLIPDWQAYLDFDMRKAQLASLVISTLHQLLGNT